MELRETTAPRKSGKKECQRVLTDSNPKKNSLNGPLTQILGTGWTRFLMTLFTEVLTKLYLRIVLNLVMQQYSIRARLGICSISD